MKAASQHHAASPDFVLASHKYFSSILKGMSTVGNTANIKKCLPWDFPSGPVVKNPCFNEGDTGSIPGRGAEIPHTVGQLNPSTTTREASMAQPPRLSALEPTLHDRRSPHPATRKRKGLCTSMETQCIKKKKKKKASFNRTDSLESETDTKEN